VDGIFSRVTFSRLEHYHCASVFAWSLALGCCPNDPRVTPPEDAHIREGTLDEHVDLAQREAPHAPCAPLREREARASAISWLSEKAAAEELPPGFSALACESHCLERSPQRASGEPCGSWQCPFTFGHKIPGETAVRVLVYVDRCGGHIYTPRPYSRCFDKPHRCRFSVDYERAKALAAQHGAQQSAISRPRLTWDADAAEFHWVIHLDAEELRISSHDEGKVWRLPDTAAF
jgi:hypothetical protein